MDIMYTLSKKAGISEKDYRMWYKLNEDTEIAVRTSVGESKTELVKNSVGQGSFGAALASSINIGCAVQDALKGKKSTYIGHLDLNSLIMQDDIAKVSTSLAEARQRCEDIYKLLTRKQLSVNDTKCKFMILGSKKQRKQALKELEKEPMMMGGRKINHAGKEKYLGDFVNELGCKQSIDGTIK